MEIIYTILALIFIEWIFDGLESFFGLNDKENNNSNLKQPEEVETMKKYEHSMQEDKDVRVSKKNSKSEEFEEADSIYDRYGNEHEVDYDGYCEDCDDYHW